MMADDYKIDGAGAPVYAGWVFFRVEAYAVAFDARSYLSVIELRIAQVKVSFAG
jgi:hypothetical protein